MNALPVYGSGCKKLLLALLFCCALLGIGAGNVAEIKPKHFAAALFAQDSDESQPESPLPSPQESAAAQPESPLAEPESKSDDAADAQPESPLKKPELAATEEPTAVPSKTPEPTATVEVPTATITPEPTATPEPTETTEPTPEPTELPETVALTETIALTSTGNVSSTQVILLPGSGRAESISVSGEQEVVQLVTEPLGTQTVNAAPVALAELFGLLGATGARPFLLTENLILALLCIIAFSVMWLGICALSVCLFYIRSRQSTQINDYARSDRHMIVHYRR